MFSSDYTAEVAAEEDKEEEEEMPSRNRENGVTAKITHESSRRREQPKMTVVRNEIDLLLLNVYKCLICLEFESNQIHGHPQKYCGFIE